MTINGDNDEDEPRERVVDPNRSSRFRIIFDPFNAKRIEISILVSNIKSLTIYE